MPEGAIAIDPAGTAPGLVVPADDQVVIVLPGPPRELQADVAAGARLRARARAAREGRPLPEMSMRMFGIPESELAQSLREIERETDLGDLEITTCLRGRRAGDRRAAPRRGRDGGRGPRARPRRPPRALRLQLERRERSRTWSRGCWAAGCWPSAESCTGGLAGGALHRGCGRLDLVRGRRRRVLERGEERAARRRRRADRGPRRGLAGGRRGDGGRRADALRSRRGGRGHGGRRARAAGTESKPVGYVCFCAKLRSGEKLARDPVLPGDRGDIRQRSTVVALHLVRYLLEGREPPR